MHLRLRIAAMLVFAAALAFSAHAEDGVNAGKLIPRVAAQSGFTYALYLPSAYSSARTWPVIFVLDPGARGAAAAERFVTGAEQHGFIIAASNDSRNGPIRMDAITAMVDDVTRRFAVDPRRVYLSGMSGGARTAIYVANKCKECAGVVAVGAGFSDEKSFDSRRLMFFGIAGLYDFNYPELLRNLQALQRRNATSRFESFDGDHQWAPAEALTRAMAWLRLQEMKRGTIAPDSQFIATTFEQDFDHARRLREAGDSYRAYIAFRQVGADFSGLHDIATVEKEIETLKDSREVKEGAKAEREQLDTQQRFEAPVLKLIYDVERGNAEATDPQRAQSLAADLRKSLEREKDPNRIIALRRTLGSIRVVAFGASESTRTRKDFSATAALYSIARETRPDSPELTYNLACAYALQGDKKKALRELQRAIQLGFRNLALLQTDTDLKSLRNEAEFQKMITNR